MNNPAYIIRGYQPADFDSFALMKTEAEKLRPAGRCLSLQDIAKYLARPNYVPERDLLMVETGGNTIGYMDITWERLIRRVILDCWINPEHRRKGLATKLLGCALPRAKELGARVAHVNVMEDNEVARKVLAKLGFQCVRRFLELRLDTARVCQQDIDPVALECRHLGHGEEDKLTQIQNRCFAGSWGYNPNTVEEIIYRINLSGCSPEDILLTYEGGKAIGYCWTEVIPGREAAGGEGRISMLGTEPEHRGKGVGKRVLTAGLTHLSSKGVHVIEVTVDSENEAAIALYQSVGFEVCTSSLWYERAVN
jgi:mycothiol synthase